MSSELDRMGDADQASSPLFPWAVQRSCKKCGDKSVYGRYVHCYKCRSLNKAKEVAKQARKAALQETLARIRTQMEKSENENATPAQSSMPHPRSNNDVLGGGGGERKALSGAGANIPKQPKATTTTTTMSKKKAKAEPKVPIALRDLGGKEKELAMSMMKRYVKREARSRGITSSSQADTDPELGNEYQTATALYGGIRSKCNTSKKIQFRGFHTIIPTPEIDHKKRLQMVISDIRKIARVPFDHHTVVKRQRLADDSMHNATFQCRCSSFDPMFQPKGAYETLQWQRQRRMAETRGEKGECNGTIKIMVERDAQSHPFGIEGQRISVAIEHPGPQVRPV
ncbi:hypothetical protein MD484_g3494, partial [Candolleomyces efflorescens]